MVSKVQQTAKNSSRLFRLRGTALHCKAVGSITVDKYFHRHILKHSVLSLYSPAFKAAPAAPKLLLVAILISFIIV
jgi:hypothetical protein